MNDKKYDDYLQKRYNLTDIEFRSLQSDVANKIEQTKTNKSNQEERIMDIALDVKNIDKKEGMGLTNIEKKVEQMGGVFTIDSTEKRGTSILIDIPL